MEGRSFNAGSRCNGLSRQTQPGGWGRAVVTVSFKVFCRENGHLMLFNGRLGRLMFTQLGFSKVIYNFYYLEQEFPGIERPGEEGHGIARSC